MKNTSSKVAREIFVEDVRIINEFQESGRVFIHMNDGRTIPRMMTSVEVRHAQITRKKNGVEAFKEEIVRLFNEKYSEPQSRRAELSAEYNDSLIAREMGRYGKLYLRMKNAAK